MRFETNIMRSDLFEKLAFHKDYKIPEKPKPHQSALIYVYKQGKVIGSGPWGDLPGWLPKGVKTKLKTKHPGATVDKLKQLGYVIEEIQQDEAFQQAVERYETEVEEFFARVYDFLCSPDLLGIMQTDVTDVLFRLARAETRQKFKDNDDHHFLPSVGLTFYQYCYKLEEEMRALPGCIEDDFYGRQHLLGQNFNFSDKAGFEYAKKRFWRELEQYDESDHCELARRLITRITEHNQDRGSNDPVEIEPELLALSLRVPSDGKKETTAQMPA